VDGLRHRYRYRDAAKRIAQLAHALVVNGVKPGDRVATLGWNTYRHFEIYYAVSGIGAICHTINPRLPVSQIDFILNHAGDSWLFYDIDLSETVRRSEHIPISPIRLVALCEETQLADIDAPGRATAYEFLLKGMDEDYSWPEFDEKMAAGLCYTSGTTGAPKGVLYSHRSTILHAMSSIIGKVCDFPIDGRILPAVPMFHVNAWGLPYSAPLAGQSLIMPGPRLDGERLFRLMDEELAYSAWGVPTVWQGLLDAMIRHERKPNGLCEILVGGSAASGHLIETFEERFDVIVRHAWGMTEMSPVGTSGTLTVEEAMLPRGERTRLQLRQGRRLFGVDMAIVDDDGIRLPHDGISTGELIVRGNSVIASYFENEDASAAAFDDEGWYRTGDRARITHDGWLTIVDRVKDLIKSGGEWISSAELEEAAMRFPGVFACAAIGIPDEKWGERPLLVVKMKADQTLDIEALRQAMSLTLAKWQLPDQIVIRDDLPMTATGKVSKKDLRLQFTGL